METIYRTPFRQAPNSVRSLPGANRESDSWQRATTSSNVTSVFRQAGINQTRNANNTVIGELPHSPAPLLIKSLCFCEGNNIRFRSITQGTHWFFSASKSNGNAFVYRTYCSEDNKQIEEAEEMNKALQRKIGTLTNEKSLLAFELSQTKIAMEESKKELSEKFEA